MYDTHQDFTKKILAKFRDDGPGNMCRSDPVIKMIDLDAWNNGRSKEDKKTGEKVYNVGDALSCCVILLFQRSA